MFSFSKNISTYERTDLLLFCKKDPKDLHSEPEWKDIKVCLIIHLAFKV